MRSNNSSIPLPFPPQLPIILAHRSTVHYCFRRLTPAHRHHHPRAAPGRRQLAGVHGGHSAGRRVRRAGAGGRRARRVEEVPRRVRPDRPAGAARRREEARADRLHGEFVGGGRGAA